MSTAPTIEQHRYLEPVAPPPVDHTVAESWDEGAGIVSSGADVYDAIGSGDAGRIASSSVSFGLDALGFVADPFAGILEPLVASAIEQIPFLHEALDRLAGDPIQIRQHAKAWENASGALEDMARDYRADVDGIQTWTGPASAAYRHDASIVITSIEAGQKLATEAGQDVLAAGELIGTVRTLIRDLIAELVADLAVMAIGALATSIVTAGTSIAAFFAAAFTRIVTVVGRISTKIAKLIQDLGAAAKLLAKRVDDFGRAIKPAVTRLRKVSKWAEGAQEKVEKYKIDKLVEKWKDYEDEDESADTPGGAPWDWRGVVAREAAA